MEPRRFLFGAALVLASALIAAPPFAAEMKGVDVANTIEIDGQPLKLQGLGLRKKFVFSVYVAALYLATPTTDSAAAIAADEPKRIVLHFLRDVPADKMRETFEEGFFNNSQEKLGRLRDPIQKFLSLFDREIEEGQKLSFTYLPGHGTFVMVDKVQRGMVEGRDFMVVLWSVWLGDVPEDHDLKRGMLGVK